jgi:hypothetical protein
VTLVKTKDEWTSKLSAPGEGKKAASLRPRLWCRQSQFFFFCHKVDANTILWCIQVIVDFTATCKYSKLFLACLLSLAMYPNRRFLFHYRVWTVPNDRALFRGTKRPVYNRSFLEGGRR